MNRFFNILRVAVIAISLFSCSIVDDGTDKNDTVLPDMEISEITGHDMGVLDSLDYTVGSFTFKASGAWSISADKMWVTFSDSKDGEYYADISGNVGDNTVYVKMSNEGHTYDISIANITLVHEDKEYNVSTIKRFGKKFLTVITQDNKEVETIEIGHNATAWFSFKSQFECGIIDYPSWMYEPVYEEGGYRFNVIDSTEILQNPLWGELIVSDRTGTKQCNVPVKYSGMSPTVVEITGDSPWQWLASLDGKEIKSKESTDSVIIKESLEMNIICLNNDYSILFAEEIDSTLWFKTGDEAWIKATQAEDDPKAVSISVNASETSTSRTGYLFAIPAALVEEFNSTSTSHDSTNVVLDKYERYVLAQIEQKDAGFKIYNIEEDGSETEIPCIIDEESDEYIIIASNYFGGTVPDVSACNVKLGNSYTINTKLTDAEWSESHMLHYIYVKDIEDAQIRDKNWKLKIIEGEDGYYRINITVPEELDEDCGNHVVLRLYTPDVVNIKALIFNVQE